MSCSFLGLTYWKETRPPRSCAKESDWEGVMTEISHKERWKEPRFPTARREHWMGKYCQYSSGMLQRKTSRLVCRGLVITNALTLKLPVPTVDTSQDILLSLHIMKSQELDKPWVMEDVIERIHGPDWPGERVLKIFTLIFLNDSVGNSSSFIIPLTIKLKKEISLINRWPYKGKLSSFHTWRC